MVHRRRSSSDRSSRPHEEVLFDTGENELAVLKSSSRCKSMKIRIVEDIDGIGRGREGGSVENRKREES